MSFIVENERELIDQVYKQLENKFVAGFRVALVGDLGVGKTTLVRGILEKLGFEGGVTSPTFNLRKTYKSSSGLKIQHIDLYRLGSDDKREMDEYIFDEEYLTFVEWPEKIQDDLSKYDIIIKINYRNNNAREISIDEA